MKYQHRYLQCGYRSFFLSVAAALGALGLLLADNSVSLAVTPIPWIIVSIPLVGVLILKSLRDGDRVRRLREAAIKVMGICEEIYYHSQLVSHRVTSVITCEMYSRTVIECLLNNLLIDSKSGFSSLQLPESLQQDVDWFGTSQSKVSALIGLLEFRISSTAANRTSSNVTMFADLRQSCSLVAACHRERSFPHTIIARFFIFAYCATLYLPFRYLNMARGVSVGTCGLISFFWCCLLEYNSAAHWGSRAELTDDIRRMYFDIFIRSGLPKGYVAEVRQQQLFQFTETRSPVVSPRGLIERQQEQLQSLRPQQPAALQPRSISISPPTVGLQSVRPQQPAALQPRSISISPPTVGLQSVRQQQSSVLQKPRSVSVSPPTVGLQGVRRQLPRQRTSNSPTGEFQYAGPLQNQKPVTEIVLQPLELQSVSNNPTTSPVASEVRIPVRQPSARQHRSISPPTEQPNRSPRQVLPRSESKQTSQVRAIPTLASHLPEGTTTEVRQPVKKGSSTKISIPTDDFIEVADVEIQTDERRQEDDTKQTQQITVIQTPLSILSPKTREIELSCTSDDISLKFVGNWESKLPDPEFTFNIDRFGNFTSGDEFGVVTSDNNVILDTTVLMISSVNNDCLVVTIKDKDSLDSKAISVYKTTKRVPPPHIESPREMQTTPSVYIPINPSHGVGHVKKTNKLSSFPDDDEDEVEKTPLARHMSEPPKSVRISMDSPPRTHTAAMLRSDNAIITTTGIISGPQSPLRGSVTLSNLMDEKVEKDFVNSPDYY